MRYDDPLAQIWTSYITTKDCFKIARRAVSTGMSAPLRNTGFVAMETSEAARSIDTSRTEAIEFTVLALWTVFERYIVEYIQGKSRKLADSNSVEVERRLGTKISESLEYWRFDELLALFKGAVDPTLLGNARQIKQFRDWVVHKNLKRGAPPRITPEAAYSVLSQIISDIRAADSEAP